jgi:hypothetical protein
MTEENPSQPWITIHSKLLSFVIVIGDVDISYE